MTVFGTLSNLRPVPLVWKLARALEAIPEIGPRDEGTSSPLTFQTQQMAERAPSKKSNNRDQAVSGLLFGLLVRAFFAEAHIIAQNF